MSFKFIQATAEDRAYLLELRKLTMVEHLERSGLYLSDEEHETRVDHAYDCSHLISYNEEIVGTLKYREHKDRVEIIQVQIHPASQGRGLGRRVLEQLIVEAGSRYLSLSVLKVNPAVRLYERLGFHIVGEDEHEFCMQTRRRH